MKNTEIAALSLLAALVSPAMAQDSGVSFGHKNWELACDNTNTCRAAGYANEDEPSDSNGSVLLTRIAADKALPFDINRAQAQPIHKKPGASA